MIEFDRRGFLKSAVAGGAALAVRGVSRCADGSPAPNLSAAPVAFPIGPSEDRRYLIDSQGRPFFVHADTAWNLPKKLTLDEAKDYLDDRTRRGFTAVLLHAVGKEQGPMTNRAGHDPFAPTDDILKPVEAYWKHLDAVLAECERRGLLVFLAPLWIRWGGTDKQGWRNQLTDLNARPYGQFLGERYGKHRNLVWILGGDANPKEKTEAIRKLASGIREKAPGQLLTVHNAPENASAAHFADDDWLDINLAYSYREVYRHILPEYRERKPIRPIVLGESGYEDESNDKRGGAPVRMRRQAYCAILSGALGGHAFGQRHVWRVDPEWRAALDSPATRQMEHVKTLFTTRAWFRLVPDADNETLVGGYGDGDTERAVAARTADGQLVLAYVPSPREVTIDLNRLAGPTTARWFDPTDGTYTMIDGSPVKAAGLRRFAPPERNAAGDGDFVLVLEIDEPPNARR